MTSHQGIAANGTEFAYLAEGPEDGPLALLLHGFPDAAPTWRHLLPALAGAGYRAVAPWMRGYAPSAVPPDGRYHTGALVADACALHEVLGGDERAVVIGHDWGAVAAYGAGAFAPDRWRRVVAMAVPPAPALAGAFLDYDQLRRSWYMFFFQHPLADAVVDAGFVERLWRDWSPGYDPSEDLPAVTDALGKPENMTAALGYYRALFGTSPVPADDPFAGHQAAAGQVPPQPTLYLHGTQDGCHGLNEEQVKEVPTYLGEGSESELIEGVGHFMLVEKPEEINDRILGFLGRA